MFRNMKIEINEEQPLNEVVKELGRLGYTQVDSCRKCKSVVTYDFGYFVSVGLTLSEHKLTTLAELKEM